MSPDSARLALRQGRGSLQKGEWCPDRPSTGNNGNAEVEESGPTRTQCVAQEVSVNGFLCLIPLGVQTRGKGCFRRTSPVQSPTKRYLFLFMSVVVISWKVWVRQVSLVIWGLARCMPEFCRF